MFSCCTRSDVKSVTRIIVNIAQDGNIIVEFTFNEQHYAALGTWEEVRVPRENFMEKSSQENSATNCATM